MGSKASRKAELWRERVLAQGASGLSVRGWCRANDCTEHGFYRWRANLGLLPNGKRRMPKPATMAFARVVVEPPVAAAAGEPLRLTLAGGRELMLPASMPLEQVARLVRAIEGAGPAAAEGAA